MVLKKRTFKRRAYNGHFESSKKLYFLRSILRIKRIVVFFVNGLYLMFIVEEIKWTNMASTCSSSLSNVVALGHTFFTTSSFEILLWYKGRCKKKNGDDVTYLISDTTLPLRTRIRLLHIFYSFLL